MAFAAGITIPASSTINVNTGTLNATGDLTNSGTLQATSGAVALTGNWTNNGTFTAGTSTVTFNGSVAQTITGTLTGASGQFYNLTIDNTYASPDDSNDVDAAQIAVTNTLTVNDGQFQPATNSDFNTVTINTNGILKPDDSAVITVSGNWTNSGTFTHNSGTVTLDGTNQTLTGSSTFYTLSKTVTSAATLTFDNTATQTSANALTLQGASGQLLSLASDAASAYNLNLQAGGTQSLAYLNVQYSDASGGMQLVAGSTSTDSGNNTNWIFDGTTVTWDGSSSTDWDTGSNWDLGLVPRSTDSVVIANVANNPILGSATTVSNLTINSGVVLSVNGQNLTVSGTYSNSGTLQLNGDETTVSLTNDSNSGLTKFVKSTGTITIKNLSPYYNLEFDSNAGADGNAVFTLPAAIDVNNNLTITDGALDVSASNYQINVGGNWTNSSNEATTFNARSGTVTLDGTSQTLTGSTTFYTLSKTVTSAATLTFDNTATQTIANSLTLQGASGQLLSLRSDSSGAQFDIDLQAGGTHALAYLNVKDSNAAGLILIAGSTSTDSGNNTNWIFGATTYTWDGSTSTDWDTGSNWDLGVAPGSIDTAVIADVSNQPVLGSAVTITNLTINSGATLDLAGKNLTVSGTASNNDTIILDGNETVTWTNDINSGIVKYDGSGNYTGGTGLAAGDSYYNLEFNGTGSWDLDANLNVDGTFNLTNGTFDMNDKNMNVAGNFTLASGTTFTKGTGTLTFDGDLSFADNTSPQQDLGAVAIGASPDTTTLTTNLTASSLTINAGDTLITNGYNLYISGAVFLNNLGVWIRASNNTASFSLEFLT